MAPSQLRLVIRAFVSDPAGAHPYSVKFGFAVKVLGKPGLKSHDTRRWQSGPHLRTSLEYLREVFTYLDKQDIRMYRMSSDLAPYATHPDMPQFHSQIRECASELRDIGSLAREYGLRLSFHPSQYVVINGPDPELTRKGLWDLNHQSEILDAMELGPEAVVIVHVGGMYGDKPASLARWADAYRMLGEPGRRRVVLENDDIRFSAADVYELHERTGVQLVFDNLHHWCNNPERLDAHEMLGRFLRTWRVRPKIHYSSPRTEMREVKRKNRKTGKAETVLQAPIWTGHADFINPFEFIPFLRGVARYDFDVMFEAKAKDLAVLRLRRDLVQYAPDLAAALGLTPAVVAEPIPEEVLADELVA